MKKIILSALIAFCSLSAFSQVGIGTTNVDNSAILELKSSNKGMLFPRLTNNEMNAIATPADGLTIYNKDEKCLFIYKDNNAAWTNLCLNTANSNENLPLSNERQTKIKISDMTTSASFGYAVSMSKDGKRFVASAHNRLALYVYSFSGGVWKQDAKLLSMSTGQNMFGEQISMSGDGNTIVAGVPRDGPFGSQNGHAEVFYYQNGAWNPTPEKIVSSHPIHDEMFGMVVSMNYDGSKFAITTNYVDKSTSGVTKSRIDVMTKIGNTWTQETLIDLSSATFGTLAISADGNTVVGGARVSEIVYVFSKVNNTWVQNQLTPTTPLSRGGFARAVAITSDGSKIAVVGSNGVYQGTMYVYSFSGGSWSQEADFLVGRAVEHGVIGGRNNNWTALAISDDGLKIAVGAFQDGTDENLGDTPGAYNSGAIFVFSNTAGTWSEEVKLKANDAGVQDNLGASISMNADGSKIVGGASNEDSNSEGRGDLYGNSGAVYVF